jgi:hypothetical protein
MEEIAHYFYSELDGDFKMFRKPKKNSEVFRKVKAHANLKTG